MKKRMKTKGSSTQHPVCLFTCFEQYPSSTGAISLWMNGNERYAADKRTIWYPNEKYLLQELGSLIWMTFVFERFCKSIYE
eukprot:1343771-Amorphochlora_amoeboformis.AAC.1